MRRHQPAPESLTCDFERTDLERKSAEADVERMIIGRIIARTGPGSLQHDLAGMADSNSDAWNVNRTSTRQDQRFTYPRLRLRS